MVVVVVVVVSMSTRIGFNSVMCPQSFSRGCNTSASVTVTVTVNDHPASYTLA